MAESDCLLASFEVRIRRVEQTVAAHMCWNFKRATLGAQVAWLSRLT